MNSSSECSNCQLVSFASSGPCKRCGTWLEAKTHKWLTSMWVGLAAFAVIGVTLWTLALSPSKSAPVRTQVSRLPGSSRVAGQQFASRAEQTEWLVDTTSAEDCKNLDRTVLATGPCETQPLQDQAMRSICSLKAMKVENPAQWELTLKQLALPADQH